MLLYSSHISICTPLHACTDGQVALATAAGPSREPGSLSEFAATILAGGLTVGASIAVGLQVWQSFFGDMAQVCVRCVENIFVLLLL